MSTYRWSCNACGAGNEPEVSVCNACGCPSTASTEDIEKHRDPKGFEKNKAKEHYSKKLFYFFVIPTYAVIFAANGNQESLLFLVLVASVLLFQNLNLFKFIWADKWARNTLTAICISNATIFLIRIFIIPNNSSYVGWLAFSVMAFLTAQYFYFFKSRKGRNFFTRFYNETSK